MTAKGKEEASGVGTPAKAVEPEDGGGKDEPGIHREGVVRTVPIGTPVSGDELERLKRESERSEDASDNSEDADR